jgi:hypothetical protein
MSDLLRTVGVLAAVAAPLTISVLALLDAARRPAWAWALAGRTQVAWIATILFGTILVPLGLVVSTVYLVRIRPRLAATEEGRIDP